MLLDQGSKDTLHFETNLLYDLKYSINYLNEVQKILFYCLNVLSLKFSENIKWVLIFLEASHALSALTDWLIFKGEQIALVS